MATRGGPMNLEKERALERWRDLAFRASGSQFDDYLLRDTEREAYLFWASL